MSRGQQLDQVGVTHLAQLICLNFNPFQFTKALGKVGIRRYFQQKIISLKIFFFYELDDAQVPHFDNDDDDDEQVSHLDAGGGVHNLEPDGKP